MLRKIIKYAKFEDILREGIVAGAELPIFKKIRLVSGVSFMDFRMLLCLFLLMKSHAVFCQTSYNINKQRRLESITCHLNDTEVFNVQFDKKSRVNKILKLNRGLVHGFVYYLTKNKLDSIRRYDKGNLTPELYVMKGNGQIKKHILLLGTDRDSIYEIKNGKINRLSPFPLSLGINNQGYELDSNGFLKRLYDQDFSDYPSSPLYNIYLSSHGLCLSEVFTYHFPEWVMFIRGELAGLYSYRPDFIQGFRLYFHTYPRSRLYRLSVNKDGVMVMLFFKKNGRLDNRWR